MMSAPILDRMTALADGVRSRMLLVLERHELTVSELRTVFQLPQSTVSRHLKILGSEGWVTSRVEGTSRHYSLASHALDASSQRLWRLVREQVAALPAAAHDARRVQAVLAKRRTQSQAFFATAAGEWDRVRRELFGPRPELTALLAFIDEGWTVGDLGCGTGQVAESLAPFVRRVVAVDDAPAMLRAARARLGGLDNVDLRSGTLESLPVEDGELDAAVLFLVLHHVPEPAAALAEARRALRPGGRLLVVDMLPHDRAEYRRQMGHVWQGFSEEQLGGWLDAAGFEGVTYRPLPPEASAKGPGLFAAAARRVAAAPRVAVAS